MQTQRRVKFGQASGGRHRNTAVALARILLIQAIRQAGGHQFLKGKPCVLGFVIGRSQSISLFTQGVNRIFESPGRGGIDPEFETYVFKEQRTTPKRKEADLPENLATAKHIAGFAASEEDFPDEFRLSADIVMQVPKLSKRTLRSVFRAVMGASLPEETFTSFVELPLQTIGLILRPGRDARSALSKLESAALMGKRPALCVPAGPALDDLSGYGEAAVWGKMLSADLRDYSTGKIGWKEVDRGIILSGKPGTGKTMFARALATTCQVPVFMHSLARWQAKGCLNDLLVAMHSAFDEARDNAPSILFLDELDAFGDRSLQVGHNAQYVREVINGFLECLDGAQNRKGVVVIGATNMPEAIDPAILRAGRLERIIEIPVPDTGARLGILRHHLKSELKDIDLAEVATRTDGATGADIEYLVRSARRRARLLDRPLNEF